MDFCGNPFHDIPQLLILAAPFMGFVGVWIRGRFKRHEHGADCAHG